VEFYDIAGLVKGANKGEGLGNQFLANIKETQAIVIVLRVFQDPDIIHVENSVDALRDLEIINTELILKDLEAVEKQFSKMEAEARAGKKEAIQNREELGKIKKTLEDGALPVSSPEILGLIRANKTIRELNLLTAKKQLYLLNGAPSDVPETLTAKIKELGADSLVLDLATTESVGDLIRKAYDILNLISYFTTGEDETRAWTIERGTKAPQASGVIHTDFEEKFIRLEAIDSAKLLEAGSWTVAKQKGWLRLEGKEYEVKDGDVVVVRHG
jgi:ribosome-binding ATPase YchF (GTP1/OBG family)